MAYKEQIARIVDDGIAQGRIQAGMRDQYLQMFTKDEQAAEFFASNMLRGQDYTHKTQAIARERQEFERQRQAQLEADAAKRRELEQWEQGARQQLTRAQQLEVELARAKQVLNDYGFEFKSSDPSPSPSAPQVGSQGSAPANPAQSNRFLTREEGIGALQELVGLQSQAMTFAGHYQQLFGRPLTDDIISEAVSQNLTPAAARQYWETKYNVAGRAEELAAQRRAEEEAALRARIREEVLNEVISNPSRVVGGQPQAAPTGLVFDRYATSGSRALQGDSGNQPGAPADLNSVAPEKRPDLQTSARRISSAVDFAMRNYTPDGTPRLQGGPAQG